MRNKTVMFLVFCFIFIIMLSGCGSGTLYYDDGTKYEGELKDDEPHGHGTGYYSDGTIMYEGEWEDGLAHGKGTAYWEDGTILYEGEWEDGEPMN